MHYLSKKHLQKIAATCLAVTLTLSATPAVVFAAETNTLGNIATTAAAGFSPVFSDVKLGHWAEKHIHKLAALDILKGNNGMFRPNDDITQQEVITVALRYMNLEGQLASADSVQLPADFVVGNYFKPYVVLAFQKGLLVQSEEMTSTGEKNNWGAKKASREWVAKVLVRAIGKDGDAQSIMSMPSSFSDNDKIAKDALGYVNVAVSLGLATGMDKNRFEPKGNVNRAQVATFFSRADDKVEYVNTNSDIFGIVTSITDSQIKLYSENNRIDSTKINANTMFYKKNSDQMISAKDIPLYTKVRLIGKDGVSNYIELVDETKQVETVTATLKYSEGNSLWVKYANQEGLNEVKLDSTSVITDGSGNVITISQIVENAELTIIRETFSGNKQIIEIQLKSSPVNKSGKGIVTTLDRTSRTLSVTDDKGTVETFTVADDAVIRVGDKILNDGLLSLNVNDAISYTVKNSTVTAIILPKTPETSVEGKLMSLGNNNTLITVRKADNQLEAKMLAPSVAVYIEGMLNATVDNLLSGEDFGDQVKLTLNSNDQVIRVDVVSRKVKSLYGANVIGYDAKSKLLTVEDDSKRPEALRLSDATTYELNGVKVTAESVIPMLNGNRKVNIQFTDKNVLLVQFVYKYEGTLITASTATRTITLKLTNEQIITLPYMGNFLAVSVYGKSNATTADLKAGDQVTVMLSPDQGSAISLSVRSSQQFDVTAVNSAVNRLTLRHAVNQTSADYSVSSVPIYGLSGEKLAVANIKEGDVFNASFDGSTLTELRQVAVTIGRVQSVDASNGTVMVKGYNNDIQSYFSANGVNIIIDSNVTTNLSSLQIGDRVEARKDASGKAIIKVIPGTKKTYWKYEAGTKTLYVKRSSLTDNSNFYKLHENISIHDKANQTLSVESLKDGDSLVLYFQNGQIIEVEKQ